MKMKYLLLAMFSVCSINFVHAEVVPGFSSSETYSPSGNTTVGFYETGGDGGNYMEWVIQNQCDVATDVTPNKSFEMPVVAAIVRNESGK